MAKITYDELVAAIKDMPRTWYPALLRETMKAAHAKRVFCKKGLTAMTMAYEDELDAIAEEQRKST